MTTSKDMDSVTKHRVDGVEQATSQDGGNQSGVDVIHSTIDAFMKTCASVFPEAANLRVHVHDDHVGDGRNHMSIDIQNMELEVHALDYASTTPGYDLSEDLVHELSHVAWDRERFTAGYTLEHKSALGARNSSDLCRSVNEAIYLVDELGAEIVATERCAGAGITYGILGGCRAIVLDNFAWLVAKDVADFPSYLASQRPRPGEDLLRLFEAHRACALYALRRYADLRTSVRDRFEEFEERVCREMRRIPELASCKLC